MKIGPGGAEGLFNGSSFLPGRNATAYSGPGSGARSYCAKSRCPPVSAATQPLKGGDA